MAEPVLSEEDKQFLAALLPDGEDDTVEIKENKKHAIENIVENISKEDKAKAAKEKRAKNARDKRQEKKETEKFLQELLKDKKEEKVVEEEEVVHWVRKKYDTPSLMNESLGPLYLARCKVYLQGDAEGKVIEHGSTDTADVTCQTCLELLMENIRDAL